MNGRKHETLQAGGKVYNLRMSFNALAMFEEDIGPIGYYFNTSAPKSIAGCRGVIWAGVNSYGSASITIEEAGDFCEDYCAENGFKSLAAKVSDLMKNAGWMPKGNGDDAGKNQNQKPEKVSET